MEHQRRAADAGISMVTEFVDGKPIPKRRVICVVCGSQHLMAHSVAAPADQVRQKFERLGWRLGTKGSLCPLCAKPVEKVKEVATTPNAVKSLPAPIRIPAPADKARIRQYLDGHFDDSKGIYLDGGSDEAAGKAMDVPWAWVRDLREFAYGPIREDPAITALRVELTDAAAKLAILTAQVEDMMKRIK